MTQSINRSRLLVASCFGIITTAMIFAIRAGVLTQLGTEFNLTSKELGYVNQMAFLGFPIAMIFGGPLYNIIGPRKIIWVAFVTHLIGIVSTIFADGFWTLLISTFFVGLGNGTVEAACNPLVADMYEGKLKTQMLNRLHMWFPGGIVIGSLVSKFMTEGGLGWQLQMGIIMIPLAIYIAMFAGQAFPETKAEEGVSNVTNIKAMLSPLYIFMLLCMALTSISEFGTTQWVEPILGKAGASPLLILALVTGLMAVGRYFAGPLVHNLNPTGVLWTSALITTIGIVLMSQSTGAMVYVSAVIFAIGVCYFWPTMIGFVAEYIPKSGAFGLSIMGGMGMFSTSIFQPIIGGWIDDEQRNAAARGLSGDAMELAAGQEVLDNMAIFPAILIIAFGVLWFMMRNKKPDHHQDETLVAEQPQL